MAQKKKTPEQIAAAAVAKRSGFLPYSRYDKKTGALTDPEGTTVFSHDGPLQRGLRRLTGREELPPKPKKGLAR